MSLPPAVAAKILQLVVELSGTAFRGAKLVRRVDIVAVGNYSVRIVRRGRLGADRGVSQMVKVFRNAQLAEVWHVVAKAGRIIHKDVKRILKK